ncbi:unnamed protein product, partial [Bubo scandiacus]
MLKLEKALSNQNMPALPDNGAARPNSMGLTQAKQPRKSDGALYEGKMFRATLHCCQLKNNDNLYLVLPSNCTGKVNGKAPLLDQA